MPLARPALYAEPPEVYVALATDEGKGWFATVRHIARGARRWVVSGGTALLGNDLPGSMPGGSGPSATRTSASTTAILR